jgi:hypothetical protein
VGAGRQSRAAGQVPAQAYTGSEAIVAGGLARGWRAAEGDRRVKLAFARNPAPSNDACAGTRFLPIHARPAWSISSNALHFRRSVIATLARSP